MREIMLKLIDLCKNYDLPGDSRIAAVLKDINLDVEKGRSIAIVGPSGSGKSTLLNIIGALDRPTSGHVLLNGRDLSSMSEPELAEIRNKEIGFVFQLHHLLPQCTVLENVLVPTLARSHGNAKELLHQRAVDFLEYVGMKDFLFHRPGELSGGQRQRVAVVRALINKPALLLADEPTGSLDRENAENIVELLVDLNRKKEITLIMVTHSAEMACRMQKVLILDNGVLKERISSV
ncbi:MAG: ABC transporter ATP-binding protein [Candidatus Brocadiia bacterium]|nr:MAG: ABC transporter ATP-binding protein [Candidatus Brocadiia bacterium]